ncbi:MAG: hypothetical protein AAGA77_16900 [Bacteroidota bacterium]
MSSENVALSLKDIILGLSESLNQAQDVINNSVVGNEGGIPGIQYTIPELNFSIEVEANFNSPVSQTSANLKNISNATEFQPNKKSALSMIAFKPLPAARVISTPNTTNRLTSNISGKFIATMPNAGLPKIEIIPSITSLTNTQFEVSVLIVNSVGEVIENQEVEFNYNALLTKNLNGIENIAAPTLVANVLKTDSEGKVKNTVTVGADSYNYIIDINVGNLEKRISIQSISQQNG